MLRTLRLGIVIPLLALILPVAAVAQDESSDDATPGAVDDITKTGSWIDSDPRGALIELGGATRVRGFTPWRVDDRIRESYTVTAALPGYENWRGHVNLDGTRNETYSLELTPKTRAKALVRSLVIPGWGQRYAGSRGRGNLLFGAEAVALFGLLLTNNHYESEVKDWEEARDAYLSEIFEENLDARSRTVAKARDDADDAYTLRQAFFYSSVGIMALNVLDVLLFTPVGPSSGVFLVSPAQGTASASGEAEAQVGLGYRF